MNQYLKNVVLILGFITLLGGSFFLYQNVAVENKLFSKDELKLLEEQRSTSTIQVSNTSTDTIAIQSTSQRAQEDSDLDTVAIQPGKINQVDTKPETEDIQDYEVEKKLVSKILNTYIDATVNGTLATVEDYVTERSKEDWAQIVQNNPYPNGFPRESINIVSISDPDINGNIIVLIKLGDHSPGTMVFMKENGEWKIDLKLYSTTEHNYNYEYRYVSKEIQMFRVDVYPYSTTYSDDYISGYNVCTSSYFSNLKNKLGKIDLTPICQNNTESYLVYVTMSEGINRGVNFCSDSVGNHGWTSNKISDGIYKCPEVNIRN